MFGMTPGCGWMSGIEITAKVTIGLRLIVLDREGRIEYILIGLPATPADRWSLEWNSCDKSQYATSHVHISLKGDKGFLIDLFILGLI